MYGEYTVHFMHAYIHIYIHTYAMYSNTTFSNQLPLRAYFIPQLYVQYIA